MERIKDIWLFILENLARYGYLVTSQVHDMGKHDGRFTTKNYIYTHLRKLRKAKYIDYIEDTNTSNFLHYLTPKGVKLITENLKYLDNDIEEIRYPKSDSVVERTIVHRISFVNTWIAYDRWIKQKKFETVLFDTYFDFVGSNKNKSINGASKQKTWLPMPNARPVIPDGIICYQTPRGKKLFMWEVHNGDDSARIVKQLRSHCFIILKGIASDKYDLKVGAKVLVTFELESCMKAAMRRMMSDQYFDMDGIEDYFLFKVAEETWKDFGKGWIKLTGEKVNLDSL